MLKKQINLSKRNFEQEKKKELLLEAGKENNLVFVASAKPKNPAKMDDGKVRKAIKIKSQKKGKNEFESILKITYRSLKKLKVSQKKRFTTFDCEPEFPRCVLTIMPQSLDRSENEKDFLKGTRKQTKQAKEKKLKSQILQK